MTANEELTKRFLDMPADQCIEMCNELGLVDPDDAKLLKWMDFLRKAFANIYKKSLHSKVWEAINEKTMTHEENPYDRAELIGLLSFDLGKGMVSRSEAEKRLIDPDKEREAERIAEKNMFGKSPLDEAMEALRFQAEYEEIERRTRAGVMQDFESLVRGAGPLPHGYEKVLKYMTLADIKYMIQLSPEDRYSILKQMIKNVSHGPSQSWEPNEKLSYQECVQRLRTWMYAGLSIPLELYQQSDSRSYAEAIQRESE